MMQPVDTAFVTRSGIYSSRPPWGVESSERTDSERVMRSETRIPSATPPAVYTVHFKAKQSLISMRAPTKRYNDA